MSKIRMAFFDDYSFIGIAFINPDGTRAAIKISIPQRKRHMLKRVVAEGLDFPEPKPANKEEPSKLILPANVLLQQEAEKTGGPRIVEY